jgi:hypothetical protein
MATRGGVAGHRKIHWRSSSSELTFDDGAEPSSEAVIRHRQHNMQAARTASTPGVSGYNSRKAKKDRGPQTPVQTPGTRPCPGAENNPNLAGLNPGQISEEPTMAITSTLPAEGLSSAAVRFEEPSPSIHALLMKAAKNREAYLWRKVIKPSDLGKGMSLAKVRNTRKFMRSYLEKTALRIWHSDAGERAGEWDTWLSHMRAAMIEDHPELRGAL